MTHKEIAQDYFQKKVVPSSPHSEEEQLFTLCPRCGKKNYLPWGTAWRYDLRVSIGVVADTSPYDFYTVLCDRCYIEQCIKDDRG